MSLSGVTSNTSTPSTYQTKVDNTRASENTAAAKTSEETAVVYEKSSSTNAAADSKNIVAKLKADAEARTASMKSLVEKLLSKQSKTFQLAYSQDKDSIWNQIRQGNFQADAQTIAQAKEDISEDGYWGVKQTSERMLDFAKALAGGDSSKIDILTKAIEKGFKQAEKQWGGELPDICQQTYDAVMKGMQAWKDEANSSVNA
ncbi:MAG: hypothetical protein K2G89_07800 [Lachnospiraceae bacterium]|nr:hypothetical protein [Lachnospiraceae bacterium]